MNDSLGDRMKRHEHVARHVLPHRTPLIVRVDGRAFHSVLAHCDKPFDVEVIKAMQQVALDLCEEIQGAQLAYGQSDEVSVLVHPYKRFQSQCWFDAEVQKIASVCASIATSAWDLEQPQGARYPAYFDARVFALPEAEVNNYFVWRQQDAVRNSIQMLARAHFSHRECHEKNCSELQEMLHQHKGVNWSDIPAPLKRGWCVARSPGGDWCRDEEIPTFSRDTEYVSRWLALEPEATP